MLPISVPPEIAAATLAIFAGVSGYLIREYRGRARPLTNIISISQTTRLLTEVELPEKLKTILDQMRLNWKLGSTPQMRDLWQAARYTYRFSKSGQELCERLEDAIKSLREQEDSDVFNALHSVMLIKLFDDVLELGAHRGLLSITPALADAKPHSKVRVVYENTNDGRYRIYLGEKTVVVGEELERNPAIKAQHDAFYSRLLALDREAIAEFLSRMRNLLHTELPLAHQAEPMFQSLISSHYKYRFDVVIANLGSKPILVDPKASMKLINRSKDSRISIQEDCYVAPMVESEGGEWGPRDSPVPLLISPGESKYVSVMTKQDQGDMANGSAIESTFQHGTGWVCISFSNQFVSVGNATRFTTRRMPFAHESA